MIIDCPQWEFDFFSSTPPDRSFYSNTCRLLAKHLVVFREINRDLKLFTVIYTLLGMLATGTRAQQLVSVIFQLHECRGFVFFVAWFVEDVFTHECQSKLCGTLSEES